MAAAAGTAALRNTRCSSAPPTFFSFKEREDLLKHVPKTYNYQL